MDKLDESNVITCDVVIIGGSIAGNYLASLLAKLDISVHVIEAHKEIGFPMECAGIVSSRLTKLMDVPKDLVLNRIKVAKIFAPDGNYTEIKARDNPVVIDRINFDKHFHRLAEKGGVRYHLGERVISIGKRKDHIIVKSTNRSYACKVLVGCDGANSLVARYHGIKHSVITGKQVIANFTTGSEAYHLDRATCEIHFSPNWEGLFGWVIPESARTFRIGIASKRDVAKHFNTFLSRRINSCLPSLHDEKTMSIKMITSGMIPIGVPTPCAFDRAILVGDAACHVKATTGGGIVMLVIAAQIAATAIQRAFVKNDFSRKFFQKHYEGPCKKKIQNDLRLHLAIHLGIGKLRNEDYTTLFNLSKCRNIKDLLLNIADMDFPFKFILHVLQKRMFITWLSKFLWRERTFLKHVLFLLLGGNPP
nr:geranylgeranyl reductase family protein [Candidatus Sigynarchaeota archaeon]